MKFINIPRAAEMIRAGICFILYGLSLLPFIACSATSYFGEAHELTVKATFSALTCDINVNPTYWLGTLTPGNSKKHEPLQVSWTCDSSQAVSTGLKAIPLIGELDSGQEKLEMMVGDTKNGTLLWLEDPSGKIIKLTGKDTDSFCNDKAVGARSCQITPVTEVHPNDTFGIANAGIVFQIVYL